MPSSRERGPIDGPSSAGGVLRGRVTHAARGPVGGGLTPEQQEIALDVAQITLDIVGIIEPTPFADGTNALISLGRRDWLGAGLSGLGVIPYLGDLAKAGKLPGYAAKLRKAIDLARRDPKFAALLRPALERLKAALDAIPLDSLSPRLRDAVGTVKRPLDHYLGSAAAARRATDLDALTKRLLLARGFGGHVAPLVERNVRTVAEFLSKSGVEERRMLDVLSGIDLHKGVEVVTFAKGDLVAQAYDPVRGMGAWYVKAGGGVGAESVGIAQGWRRTKVFRVKQPVEVLKSRAADVLDTWTPGAVSTRAGSQVGIRKAGTRVKLDANGRIDIADGRAKIVADPSGNAYGVTARGGGEQFYFPQMVRTEKTGKGGAGWEYYKDRWRIFMDEYVATKK